jgi:hypothetical protein
MDAKRRRSEKYELSRKKKGADAARFDVRGLR